MSYNKIIIIGEELDERFDRKFFKWIWDYPKNGRKKVMELHEKYPDKAFLPIKTRRKVKKFVKEWSKNYDYTTRSKRNEIQ